MDSNKNNKRTNNYYKSNKFKIKIKLNKIRIILKQVEIN